ncbi:hypothetical protein J3Q64DRAFT_1697588 [Phycomyces blakesleeanus]|uniref:Uncharacterized protein n=2 Tax=Phycomyces blakesleeanus TaxID=4837 RepID=A0A162PT75_PHYB8|nr:hypothetical protein PHYBLDRAFT_165743 [Phycomyces blakesleeanus NRRL 1555(-)]OAD75757.1 hypothetical protein PHYBLDRAFT_165743 [Phycomyces blakesleeanus NRRL 1555(-)]|eukprot:XP_018293797.1 hypothetical protein PHYBLDRAFT_165743 [Phycomyces blakesleeanus NRRL 1555(-)]
MGQERSNKEVDEVFAYDLMITEYRLVDFQITMFYIEKIELGALPPPQSKTKKKFTRPEEIGRYRFPRIYLLDRHANHLSVYCNLTDAFFPGLRSNKYLSLCIGIWVYRASPLKQDYHMSFNGFPTQWIPNYTHRKCNKVQYQLTQLIRQNEYQQTTFMSLADRKKLLAAAQSFVQEIVGNIIQTHKKNVMMSQNVSLFELDKE